MEILPDDLWNQIFDHVPFSDILVLCKVCKYFNNCIKNLRIQYLTYPVLINEFDNAKSLQNFYNMIFGILTWKNIELELLFKIDSYAEMSVLQEYFDLLYSIKHYTALKFSIGIQIESTGFDVDDMDGHLLTTIYEALLLRNLSMYKLAYIQSNIINCARFPIHLQELNLTDCFLLKNLIGVGLVPKIILDGCINLTNESLLLLKNAKYVSIQRCSFTDIGTLSNKTYVDASHCHHLRSLGAMNNIDYLRIIHIPADISFQNISGVLHIEIDQIKLNTLLCYHKGYNLSKSTIILSDIRCSDIYEKLEITNRLRNQKMQISNDFANRIKKLIYKL